MNARQFLVALMLLANVLSTPRFAQAADAYKIDPRHTSIVFSIGHAQLSYTYGMFLRARGDYVVDKDNAANTRFKLEIEAASLFTNDQDRDKHLRSPDFFNVQQFPMITFETISCARRDTEVGPLYALTGNLTMHGVTRRIEVPMQMLAEKKGPHGDMRSGFFCQMELKRTDFDIAKGLVDKTSIGDVVSVTISFEGILNNAAGQIGGAK